jgi:hypothetical protein
MAAGAWLRCGFGCRVLVLEHGADLLAHLRLSSWPCTVVAWRTARPRTSSSVPEITIDQGFSAGNRRQ